MTIRSVGPGQPYSTIGAAVGASQDGDVLQIQAGTYTNDFAEINASITLQGVGGMVRVAATVPPPDGKAAFTINDNATFDHFEISGVQVRDLNGAAFRLQAGDLTLQDCYIHDNQTGILTTDNPDATLTILESEFARNISSGSSPATGLSHGIYVNGIGRLTIDDSYFHDASTGHHIKSRALETTITDSRIFDNAGTASYSIDLPNGGDVLIANNVIQQGAGSQNPFIIAFGEEGGIRPGSSLEVRDNVVVDDLPGGALLWNPASLPATLAGNDVFGLTASELASGPATITGTTFLATRPTLDQSSPWAGGGTTQSGTGAADTLSGGAGADSIAGFAAPLVLSLLALAAGGVALPVVLLSAATALAVLGLLAERWLMFAEATHTVTLYYAGR